MNEPGDDAQPDATRRHARRRGRDYWLRMAFLPGVLALPLFWGGLWLGFEPFVFGIEPAQLVWWTYIVLAVFWIARCAVGLAVTARNLSRNERIGAGAGWFLCLVLFNIAIGVVLVVGSCVMAGGHQL